uniref:Uncharacterized protein n=1 Tax=Siphoviridae sp. ct1yA16 TaxID=2827767 RepID=A0A8S5TER5_9CAUD|nr:MAG TPA: hypothetical protein [Siphoviridae sp. ct1yA16]DAV33389.1 MAG TPA: hypothetical protein [Caudoviricetes sp.]DAV70022.1 MAG TPA: hypothetical protein [Caudoviricetes sp.]DAW71670.1 MAG TPA: hypothetical protein [Caudoviricetes sp.]
MLSKYVERANFLLALFCLYSLTYLSTIQL